jgi:hypothetical protein
MADKPADLALPEPLGGEYRERPQRSKVRILKDREGVGRCPDTILAMPTTLTLPDYSGGSLVNLMAEIERRLVGSSKAAGLHRQLAAHLPETSTIVLVVLDGLGAGQLSHPAATSLREDLRAVIDAPFPTTTTVSLASIATALPPSRHGLLGYQLHLPETMDPDDPKQASVVNTIKWTRLWGAPVAIDTSSFLPAPNLWERLRAGGVEPVTVQPGGFAGSALSGLLYRGCRFEPTWTTGELIDATVQLASQPRRLIVTYLPHIDFAAHVYGQGSGEYAEAVALVDGVWSALRSRLTPDVTLVGTADHGHIDFPPDRQIALPRHPQKSLVLYGDSRVMFVKGDGAGLADGAPASWVPAEDLEGWWGPGPTHDRFEARRPDGVLVADDRHVILHRHSDTRMTGHHGGLTAAERELPLLTAMP